MNKDRHLFAKSDVKNIHICPYQYFYVLTNKKRTRFFVNISFTSYKNGQFDAKTAILPLNKVKTNKYFNHTH